MKMLAILSGTFPPPGNQFSRRQSSVVGSVELFYPCMETIGAIEYYAALCRKLIQQLGMM